MKWNKASYAKEASLSLKCGSVNGEDYSRQVTKSKDKSDETFFYRRSPSAEQLIEKD